jgi:hypothetical protein
MLSDRSLIYNTKRSWPSNPLFNRACVLELYCGYKNLVVPGVGLMGNKGQGKSASETYIYKSSQNRTK